MALVVELELGFLHAFLVLGTQPLHLRGMTGVQSLNLISDALIASKFKIDFELMVMFQCLYFLAVFAFLLFEFVCEFLVFFGGILDIRIFDFFIGLQSDLVFLLEGLDLLPVDDVQLLFLELQLLLGTQDLEFQLLYCLVFLLDAVHTLEVEIVG